MLIPQTFVVSPNLHHTECSSKRRETLLADWGRPGRVLAQVRLAPPLVGVPPQQLWQAYRQLIEHRAAHVFVSRALTQAGSSVCTNYISLATPSSSARALRIHMFTVRVGWTSAAAVKDACAEEKSPR